MVSRVLGGLWGLLPFRRPVKTTTINEDLSTSTPVSTKKRKRDPTDVTSSKRARPQQRAESTRKAISDPPSSTPPATLRSRGREPRRTRRSLAVNEARRTQRLLDRQLGIDPDTDQRQLDRQLGVATDSDMSLQDEIEQSNNTSDYFTAVDFNRATSTIDEDVEMEDINDITDLTTAFEDAEHASLPRRKIIPIPSDGAYANFSADALRALGWDAAHIELVGRIAHRGRQAVLPQSWQLAFYFFPQELFAEDNAPFLRSWNTPTIHGELAFQKMLDLGGAIRSAIALHRRPEEQSKKFLTAYMRYTARDSGLDTRRTLPMIRIVTASQETDDKTLVANTTQSMIRLAAKYKRTFHAPLPQELTPGACKDDAKHIPTLYALVASHSMVALAALRPDDETQTLQSVAFFDFENPDLDFWNTLALCIVVCHTRNVQMSIADETGVGEKQSGMAAERDLDL